MTDTSKRARPLASICLITAAASALAVYAFVRAHYRLPKAQAIALGRLQADKDLQSGHPVMYLPSYVRSVVVPSSGEVATYFSNYDATTGIALAGQFACQDRPNLQFEIAYTTRIKELVEKHRLPRAPTRLYVPTIPELLEQLEIAKVQEVVRYPYRVNSHVLLARGKNDGNIIVETKRFGDYEFAHASERIYVSNSPHLQMQRLVFLTRGAHGTYALSEDGRLIAGIIKDSAPLRSDTFSPH
jgi:hypothetical protein